MGKSYTKKNKNKMVHNINVFLNILLILLGELPIRYLSV